MPKAKEKTDFGKHHASVRKLSSALTGFGTVYHLGDGRVCGLIAPSKSALRETFTKLAPDHPFSHSLVRKVILFERKNVSAIKTRKSK